MAPLLLLLAMTRDKTMEDLKSYVIFGAEKIHKEHRAENADPLIVLALMSTSVAGS